MGKGRIHHGPRNREVSRGDVGRALRAAELVRNIAEASQQENLLGLLASDDVASREIACLATANLLSSRSPQTIHLVDHTNLLGLLLDNLRPSPPKTAPKPAAGNPLLQKAKEANVQPSFGRVATLWALSSLCSWGGDEAVRRLYTQYDLMPRLAAGLKEDTDYLASMWNQPNKDNFVRQMAVALNGVEETMNLVGQVCDVLGDEAVNIVTKGPIMTVALGIVSHCEEAADANNKTTPLLAVLLRAQLAACRLMQIVTEDIPIQEVPSEWRDAVAKRMTSFSNDCSGLTLQLAVAMTALLVNLGHLSPQNSAGTLRFAVRAMDFDILAPLLTVLEAPKEMDGTKDEELPNDALGEEEAKESEGDMTVQEEEDFELDDSILIEPVKGEKPVDRHERHQARKLKETLLRWRHRADALLDAAHLFANLSDESSSDDDARLHSAIMGSHLVAPQPFARLFAIGIKLPARLGASRETFAALATETRSEELGVLLEVIGAVNQVLASAAAATNLPKAAANVVESLEATQAVFESLQFVPMLVEACVCPLGIQTAPLSLEPAMAAIEGLLHAAFAIVNQRVSPQGAAAVMGATVPTMEVLVKSLLVDLGQAPPTVRDLPTTVDIQCQAVILLNAIARLASLPPIPVDEGRIQTKKFLACRCLQVAQEEGLSISVRTEAIHALIDNFSDETYNNAFEQAQVLEGLVSLVKSFTQEAALQGARLDHGAQGRLEEAVENLEPFVAYKKEELKQR